MCISHNMSGIKCTYATTNIWRKANYIEDQRLQKDNIVKKASTNEASNKRSKEPIGQKKIS